MATDGGNPYGSLIIAPIHNLVANAQNVTTTEDIKKTITLTGSGGSPLTYNIVTNPKHGKLTAPVPTAPIHLIKIMPAAISLLLM
jgi:hypothetical protein